MRRNYGTSFRLYHPSDFVTWQTTSVQALYLIKFLENFHSQNIIERNTIEEMAQNLFTTLLHKTICVVVGRSDYSARHREIIFQMLYDY